MNADTPRPVAFMVMPFRKRPVPSPGALWFEALQPALEQLGYLAVRADCELGSVISKDMLERLAFADLVLADLTLPNGNVYDEVGIRHVAQQSTCVLISASWSRQLFDGDQMRSLRDPLPDGSVSAESAAAIRKVLVEQLNAVKNAKTPFHERVTDKHDSTVFREQIERLSAFQAEVRAVRMVPDRQERILQVETLIDRSRASLELRDIAFELLMLVRDNLSWQAMLRFVDGLPVDLREDDFVREQRLLAQAKLGDDARSIGSAWSGGRHCRACRRRPIWRTRSSIIGRVPISTSTSIIVSAICPPYCVRALAQVMRRMRPSLIG